MTTLLEELTMLNEKKKYSIGLNGIGSFQFVTTYNLKLANVKDDQKTLLDFSLINKKERGKYCVLEFVGETHLDQKEIVQFLLDLIGYKKKKFQPELVTVGLTKNKSEKTSLIVTNMTQKDNGKIISGDLKENSKMGTIAIIGDYYFRTYDNYQATLQNLADIWVNE